MTSRPDVLDEAPDTGSAALGRPFSWLWSAFAVSTFGTFFAFDAFPLIAILVLDAGPVAVSLLAAAGLAAGAVLAVPLGAWVEFRRKRRVMVAADLVRCGAMASVPVAYLLGLLSLAQLLAVAVVCAAADITFRAAAGAYLKGLLPGPHLLQANGRLEATTWTATAVAPPLGGAAIGLLGPVVTVVVNALSFVLSAAGLGAIRHREVVPTRSGGRLRVADLGEGWRFIASHPRLRALFLNTVSVNALILATAPPMAVLMLTDLGFAPWQYALAFGLPCAGGLLGARLSPPLVARFGRRRVLFWAGSVRVLWPVGLAAVVPGTPGLLLVMTLQFALVASIGVYNPVLVTYRLEQTPPDRTVRTLSAWSVTSSAVVAGTTALWGLLAAAAGPRAAVAAAGLLLLCTPLLLPRDAEGAETPTAGGR